MHTSSVVLLILTFLLGLFLAAYASRKEMEVVIREQQAELDKLNRKADGDAAVFSDLEETIPTLLDNLRKFLAENPLMRDLIVLETKSMGYDWPGIHLRFSEDEDPGIYTQVALLVNHGLVDEVQHEFAYRITERLARYLRKK